MKIMNDFCILFFSPVITVIGIGMFFAAPDTITKLVGLVIVIAMILALREEFKTA